MTILSSEATSAWRSVRKERWATAATATPRARLRAQTASTDKTTSALKIVPVKTTLKTTKARAASTARMT